MRFKCCLKKSDWQDERLLFRRALPKGVLPKAGHFHFWFSCPFMALSSNWGPYCSMVVHTTESQLHTSLISWTAGWKRPLVQPLCQNRFTQWPGDLRVSPETDPLQPLCAVHSSALSTSKSKLFLILRWNFHVAVCSVAPYRGCGPKEKEYFFLVN